MKKLCEECGSKKNLTRHHIKPRFKGGKNNISNYRTLCRKCHDKKHNIKDREKINIIYWKGFDDGKRNSLKHNIVLMKDQLNAIKRIKER